MLLEHAKLTEKAAYIASLLRVLRCSEVLSSSSRHASAVMALLATLSWTLFASCWCILYAPCHLQFRSEWCQTEELFYAGKRHMPDSLTQFNVSSVQIDSALVFSRFTSSKMSCQTINGTCTLFVQLGRTPFPDPNDAEKMKPCTL